MTTNTDTYATDNYRAEAQADGTVNVYTLTYRNDSDELVRYRDPMHSARFSDDYFGTAMTHARRWIDHCESLTPEATS
jgi:hypothetical protein